jgi:hypothetical protein
VTLADSAGGGVKNVSWQGLAGYVRVAISPRSALTVRGEWFDDPQGARTAVVQRLDEFTITPEFRPHPHFIIRGDLRRDHSNHPVFERGGGFTDTQVSASLNGLFVF